MRVVLHTNVLMSGVLFEGVPDRVLEAWRDGRVDVVVSEPIFREYQRVADTLAERYGGLGLTAILALVAREAEWVEAAPLPEPVSTDPDDDKFLACARAAGAGVVVSGDSDLLSIGRWKGIEILSPRQFVDAYLSE